jgi:methionyl-tRNA formyltransferase
MTGQMGAAQAMPENMQSLQIALIGREAEDYVPDFQGHTCRVIRSPDEISTQDDLVFCLSFAKIIPEPLLKRPRHGVWVGHSSDLPRGRGWAPLQWSVLNKLSHVVVTLFKADAGVDDGPYAFKGKFPIEPFDTLASLHRKDHEISAELYHKLINAVTGRTLRLQKQTGEPSYWRRRTPADSQLDSAKSLSDLWDHIRICDNDRYPAFFMIGDYKVILRYDVVKPQ